MKNLFQVIGLSILLVGFVSSCKPKVDTKLVDEIQSSIDAMDATLKSFASNDASLSDFQNMMADDAKNMQSTAEYNIAELSAKFTSLLDKRSELIAKLGTLKNEFQSNLSKYKTGAMKAADIKNQYASVGEQFSKISAQLGEVTNEISDFMSSYTKLKGTASPIKK